LYVERVQCKKMLRGNNQAKTLKSLRVFS
jgi:hypothetical protein